MMLQFLYEFLLLLTTPFFLPFLLWQYRRRGRSTAPLLGKLERNSTQFKRGERPLFWVHAVSLGEMKAVQPLIHELSLLSSFDLALSTGSSTGLAEAKKLYPEALGHFYLPLDSSFFLRPYFTKLQPTLLLICEGDLWMRMLAEAKRVDATTILVSGKLSERSAQRYALFPSFSRALFQRLDHLYLQTKEYEERFLALGLDPQKSSVGGNLKFSASPPSLTDDEISSLREELIIEKGRTIVLFASFHEGEEEVIIETLQQLLPLHPQTLWIIIPRHPERTAQLRKRMEEERLSYRRWQSSSQGETILLLDTIGKLISCYQLATMAVVGGSFIPHIGGHNILEPLHFGCPTIFGPYMENQQQIAEITLKSNAALSRTKEMVPETIQQWLINEDERRGYANRGKTICEGWSTIAKRQAEAIHKLIAKKLLPSA